MSEEDNKSEENGPEDESPEEQGPEEQGTEEQAGSSRSRRVPTGEREAVVGGELDEEGDSEGRPLIYDILGGVVLLLGIIIGLYFYIGIGGQQEVRETPTALEEPRERTETEQREVSRAAPEPVEEWSPGEFQMPPPEQADDVGVALEEAQAAMDAGRLIEPEGDNALAKFRSVLESEPDNEDAQAGIDEIVNQLVDQANDALDDGRVEEALELVSAVETIRQDAEGLANLQDRVEQSREIIELLSTASDAVQEGRLVSPEDDNALARYRAVLEIDPENSDARQGIENLERRLLEQATAAARERNFGEAESLLAQAETVREEDGAVPEARETVAEIRDQNFGNLMSRAREALEAEDYEEADTLISQAEQIQPDSSEVDALRQELTRARVYARYAPGDTFSDELAAGGQGPTMVVLPVGSFQMGSPEDEDGRRNFEGPRHQVSFSNGFALSRTEVTVGEFRRFVEATGYTTDAERSGSSSVYVEDSGRVERRNGIYWIHDFYGDRADADLPVIHVSWNDAEAYAEWLSEQTGESYRLPSEAEWEYAARADTTTPYWWGVGAPDETVENLTGERDRSEAGRSWNKAFDGYDDGYWGPAPTGRFESNPFGLMDMAGNVSEWVEDCWHDSYARAPSDGSAWVNQGCERRVVRGGSWGSPPDRTRSAYRISGAPTTHTTQVGIRVAKDL